MPKSSRAGPEGSRLRGRAPSNRPELVGQVAKVGHFFVTPHFVVRKGKLERSDSDVEQRFKEAIYDISVITGSNAAIQQRIVHFTRLYNEKLQPLAKQIKRMHSELEGSRVYVKQRDQIVLVDQITGLIKQKATMRERLLSDIEKTRRTLRLVQDDTPPPSNHFVFENNQVCEKIVNELDTSVSRHCKKILDIKCSLQSPNARWQAFVAYKTSHLDADVGELNARKEQLKKCIAYAAKNKDTALMDKVSSCLVHQQQLCDKLERSMKAATVELLDAIVEAL